MVNKHHFLDISLYIPVLIFIVVLNRRHIYRQLTSLYPKHACEEYNNIFNLLCQNCNINENNIPQLEDLSNFLKGLIKKITTQFEIRFYKLNKKLS